MYNKNSHKFIESQKFPINSSKTNYYSLMKYKDKKGTEIYKIIYTYTGIWTQSVNVNNNPAQKDLIFQDSIDGRLLEIMTIEIEESIIRSLNDINISVIGRGSGSIETIHGFAKYDINEFSFNVPGAILCGFLQKADLLPLE
ncbi:MAG TPA: hypothetical protein DDZ34_00160 [Syntrophaceae bacterium]|nr:hypothetical protein [Syntrophaceae bacterium]